MLRYLAQIYRRRSPAPRPSVEPSRVVGNILASAKRPVFSKEDFPFQPGVMLHHAVVGAFRASGVSFDAWCKEQGITPTQGRYATYGMTKGPKGRKLLAKLIEAAGPEVVRAGYLARYREHGEELRKAVS